MDDTTATILLGCRLAKDLEANLPNMANQPEFVWRTCDEIIRVFSNVKERISMSYPQMGFGNIEENQPTALLQEWLTNTHAAPSTTDNHLLRAQVLSGRLQSAEVDDVHGWIDHQESKYGVREVVLERSGGESEVGRWLREHALVAHNQAPLQMSAGASSSSPRQRRRKNEGERRRVILAAPRMGNTDIPPEDGYTWRKYGQKDILKSKFPRSYFRCTHQKLYNCAAKKQVQRLDNDPTMFEVIYRSKHTCHLSSTAPSVPPPSSTELRQDIIKHATNIHPPQPGTSYTATPAVTHCLNSMDMIMRASGQVTSAMDFTIQMGGQIGGSSGVGGGVEDQLLEYMAETMFNSGSSSNNSMDLIFPSMEDKRDSREKKN